jgi:hypothetical protein
VLALQMLVPQSCELSHRRKLHTRLELLSERQNTIRTGTHGGTTRRATSPGFQDQAKRRGSVAAMTGVSVPSAMVCAVFGVFLLLPLTTPFNEVLDASTPGTHGHRLLLAMPVSHFTLAFSNLFQTALRANLYPAHK